MMNIASFVVLVTLFSSAIVVKCIEKQLIDVEDRCTTIAVGPGAGVDGPMATHTSDCSDCDFRVNKVRFNFVNAKFIFQLFFNIR